MDNPDKLFNQIKKASEQSEAKEFPAMDKVWSRVEEKLDHKVLKKENKLWKKIAIAASFLLVFTLGYQILKPKEVIIAPEQQVVTTDPKKTIQPEVISKENAVATSEEINPVIRKDADKILEKQVNSAPQVAAADAIAAPEPAKVSEIAAPSESESDDNAVKKPSGYSDAKSKNFLKGKRTLDARSVSREYEQTKSAREVAKDAQQVIAKTDPLLVLDGKAQKQSVKEGLSKVNPDDVENIVVLKEPLYIINGHYYSEAELFGPNPTSPYAPLNQQEIETLSILQGEKAIQNYGERGRKGVVVITTKNGKPVKAATKTGN